MDKPDIKAECCTDLENESGCRNNYFDGKRLTTDSFRVEQRYLLERRHLLNRAIHGWGVVYGFAVSVESGGRLKIGPGLALDECGRELLQTGARHVRYQDVVVLDDETVADVGEEKETCWLLSVHYAEQSAGPVTVSDSCHCEQHEFDRTCETVRYSLRRIPCGECCRGFDCELQCDCAKGRCCDEHEARPQRGGCSCLCDHLAHLQPGAESCLLREVDDPCGRVRVDYRHGVPLACVTLVRDDCERPSFGGEIEACGPRRLVKRNDLLFDLIRGCDLTRIREIGWKDWHRHEVSFDDFSDALGPIGHGQPEYVTRRFWVTFSRPVRSDTLRPGCFAITVLSGEREGGWLQVFRVPIVRVETEQAALVSRATVVVDGAWVEDGVRGRRSVFLGAETWVEIEVRGDFIVDCNGQTVDANAVGLSPGPTGNGTPGGTFVSTFRVAARVKGASS
jgi:hypothetical protein